MQDIFSADFSTNGQQQPALPPKQRPSSAQREKVSSSLIALPRPPSRSVAASGPNQRRASPPAPLVPSKSSAESSPVYRPHVGLSRGPSPLTIGMSDVVPLAVAFQEVCHACFRGADESQVQVRLIGDLMVSFPAGIVGVVTNNTKNAAPLVFKIKNSSVLESVVPNKQLISPLQSEEDSKVFEFDMKALRELLKLQSEQNPGASYFNIDILKYQVG